MGSWRKSKKFYSGRFCDNIGILFAKQYVFLLSLPNRIRREKIINKKEKNI